MNVTNAARILKAKKIEFELIEYKDEQVFNGGEEILDYINDSPDKVFKTITLTNGKAYYVCMVGVLEEIDLKKCAKAFGEKSLELLPLKALTDVTGYVRGGCSPLGMKKVFPTVIDDSALVFDNFIFSGGKIGLQIEMNPNDIVKVLRVKFSSIVR